MKVLVTGNAGFIGYHVTSHLLRRGDSVVGCDVVNSYYDPLLKEARLSLLQEIASTSGAKYEFFRHNLADSAFTKRLFETQKFDRVIHLAAQAGVRHSLKNPMAYVESNISAFTNVLEGCRHSGVQHLTYASTSSVYGANTNMPFSEHHGVDHPLQFYAATKRANELMAHAYSDLFGLPTTGLRFFTVYGPWGRPDMALFIFTRKIIAGEPIQVFNNGNHTRDFTYVDDIVQGTVRASDALAQPNPDWDATNPDPASSRAPFRIFNIGNNAPVPLSAYIDALETCLGLKAKRVGLPLQAGDVPDTFADVREIEKQLNFRPTTSIYQGVANFVNWYREYYAIT